MKQLHEVEYPKDFRLTEASMIEASTINDLIKMLTMEQDCSVGKAGTLVVLANTGYVEVYKMVAECEVEVPW